MHMLRERSSGEGQVERERVGDNGWNKVPGGQKELAPGQRWRHSCSTRKGAHLLRWGEKGMDEHQPENLEVEERRGGSSDHVSSL